jgi:hypothetical protein
MSFESWDDFYFWLEELPISLEIGATWLFPFFESLHVIGAVFLLGSLLMVDLRLLGIAATSNSLTQLLRESIVWTWVAFFLALLTGLAMFITRISGYITNPAFLWKMALLLLAGLNMLYFHWHLLPKLGNYEGQPELPTSYRATGFVSLSLWAGVMLAGRWIGHIF